MKPILFNTEMVEATLKGIKTATRRLVKDNGLYTYCAYPPSRIYRDGDMFNVLWRYGESVTGYAIKPPYLPGDILYVREAWAKPFLPDSDELHYRADYSRADVVLREGPYPDSKRVTDIRWRPSIHMPKEAARLFIRVTDVRVERLQEITDDGAKAEGANNGIGVSDKMRVTAIQRFQRIWDSTIKPADQSKYGWDANPYVWVIEFERCEKPEAEP